MAPIDTGRSIELEATIAVPPGGVWKALTDPEELVRWFPLEALVVPGVGGSMWLSWSEEIAARSSIAIWEPGRHLRTVETKSFAAGNDLTVSQSADLAVAAESVKSIDYFMESFETGTILRVEHSGFEDSCEEQSIESVRRGWEFELLSLQVYLERHFGKPRSVAWVRRVLRTSPESIWERIMGPSGLVGVEGPESFATGGHCRTRAATGDEFEGTVRIYDPPYQFAAIIENLSHGLLRIKLDRSLASDKVELNFWLAAYGDFETKMKRTEERWGALFDHVFEAAASPTAKGTH